MTELTKEHFHLHDSNKVKAYEEQKEMRKELKDFISKCKVFVVQKHYTQKQNLSTLSSSPFALHKPWLY